MRLTLGQAHYHASYLANRRWMPRRLTSLCPAARMCGVAVRRLPGAGTRGSMSLLQGGGLVLHA